MIGALADVTGRRRALLFTITVASAVATALLVTVGAGDVARGIVLFAIAHVAHLLALSLYNSYLPLIADAQSLRAHVRNRVGALVPGQHRLLSS